VRTERNTLLSPSHVLLLKKKEFSVPDHDPDLDPSAAEMLKVTRPISLLPIVKYVPTFNPVIVLRN